MKKISVYVFTFLIFCSVSQAKIIEFYNCYNNPSNWKDHSKKWNLKDNIYSVNTTTKEVTRMEIVDDLEKDLKQRLERWKKRKKWAEENKVKDWDARNPYPQGTKKYQKLVYDIKNIAGNIVTAEKHWKSYPSGLGPYKNIYKINLDLNSGEIEWYNIIGYAEGNDSSGRTEYIQCKKMR